MLVVSVGAHGAVAEGLETCYLTPETPLSLKGPHERRVFSTYPGGIAPLPAAIRLHRGDRLFLCAQPLDPDLPPDPQHLRVACTLPQVLAQVRRGERVWLDDGRIGAVLRTASPQQLELEIAQPKSAGQSSKNNLNKLIQTNGLRGSTR
ncbi:MAG: hypothetical protein Q8Q84_02070 [Hydrogenophaga sp.]|nr:hypothetical protein [Hydrogenophaga sp.]